MKFEFSLTVKAVPMADCHLSIDCNAEELAIMLSDPVYQALGAKLVDEISFAPKQEQSQKADDLRRLHTQQQKHNENLRRQVEVMQHTMKILEKRIDAYRKNHTDFD